MLVVLRIARSNLLRCTSAKYIMAFSPRETHSSSLQWNSLREKHNFKINAIEVWKLAAMSGIIVFDFIS